MEKKIEKVCRFLCPYCNVFLLEWSKKETEQMQSKIDWIISDHLNRHQYE